MLPLRCRRRNWAPGHASCAGPPAGPAAAVGRRRSARSRGRLAPIPATRLGPPSRRGICSRSSASPPPAARRGRERQLTRTCTARRCPHSGMASLAACSGPVGSGGQAHGSQDIGMQPGQDVGGCQLVAVDIGGGVVGHPDDVLHGRLVVDHGLAGAGDLRGDLADRVDAEEYSGSGVEDQFEQAFLAGDQPARRGAQLAAPGLDRGSPRRCSLPRFCPRVLLRAARRSPRPGSGRRARRSPGRALRIRPGVPGRWRPRPGTGRSRRRRRRPTGSWSAARSPRRSGRARRAGPRPLPGPGPRC